MKLKLAIIGASYLQLPLVKKASAMGLETICFAWEEGAICKSVCDRFYPISITDKEKILKICIDEGINGITSIASDVAVPTVNYVAESMKLLGNSMHSATLSTNKLAMRKALNNRGLRIPKYSDGDALNSYEICSNFKFPIVIKPVDRSGSRGITIIESCDEKLVSEAINYAKEESFIRKVVIEEFIKGEEISVEGISYKGVHQVLAITDKVTTGFPHFVEVEHHQPSIYWNSSIHESIINSVHTALDALEFLNGASHSELIITETHEIYVTEIGARMGGDFIGSDLVELSTGYDFLEATINVSLGIPPPHEIQYSRCSGVHFITPDREWVKDMFADSFQSIIRSETFSSQSNTVRNSADRSGYFLYQSDRKISGKQSL